MERTPNESQRTKPGIRAKDQLIPNNAFETTNGARCLVTTDISCNEMKQAALNAGVGLNSSCIPLANTVQHGGQIDSLLRHFDIVHFPMLFLLSGILCRVKFDIFSQPLHLKPP